MPSEKKSAEPQLSTDFGLPIVEYNPDSNRFLSRFDAPTVTPSEAVISTVAVVTGQDPTDVQPLSSVIDTEALNALYPSADSPGSSTMQIEFEYVDCRVTVKNHGIVSVDPQSKNT